MHDHAHHDHEPGHGHGLVDRTQSTRRLTATLVLTSIYMVCEAIGGWLSGSLALLADAGHMLSDVAALALSLFALWIARRPATSRRTFGYYRMEILAALVNGVTLVAIALFTIKEAWQRLAAPPPVHAEIVMIVAAGGLAINLVSLWLLSGARSESLNVHGAWLHVLTDALGSVAALLAGALVWFGWPAADPVLSVLISLLVAWSAWGLMTETVSILLEGAPSHLDVDAVRDAIIAIPRVTAVHDLHVWTISSGLESLSVHVLTEDTTACQSILDEVQAVLKQRFGLTHTTIQVEAAACDEARCHF